MNKYAIGIDVGGTFIKSAVIEPDGNILYYNEHETPAVKPEQFVNLLGYISELLIEENKLNKENCLGIGLGFPGFVNPESGIVANAPNLPKWKEYNVVKAMEKWIKLPVFINNDANAAIMAEKLWGSGKDFSNIVGLTLGTGVGGGIIIDGHLFIGASYSGAELGHIVIDMNGPKCSCGKYGCLEAFIGERGFIREAKVQRKKDKGSLLWTINDGKLDAKSIEEAAHGDDAAAKKSLNNLARYLAIGIVSICETINPEIVIIGGGLSNFGELLYNPLIKHVKRIKMIAPRPIIRFSKLKNKAGVLGASAPVFIKN
ncbi:MAG: ROK family protein [Candidatus Zixiibacteriota bacterium]